MENEAIDWCLTAEDVFRMWGGIRLSNILPLRCKMKVLAVAEVHHYR